MKRLFAMLAAFGLPALAAAYVALSPLSGPSGALAPADAAAGFLAAIAGRGAAVAALAALGLVLALAARRLVSAAPDDRAMAGEPTPATRSTPADPEPASASASWRPEPLSSEELIASLRRRALGEAGEDTAAPANPARAAPPPRLEPVALARKPRERERDWFADRSWLGGLPRLGEVAWPRDAAGLPLPFAAQIDLAELAAACPASPLPRSGALAFFLGSGAVVQVPPGDHEFSVPPEDLPPAFDEGGLPFPPRAGYLTHHFFPFWPVAPGGAAGDPAPEPFVAQGQAMWWHGVGHLIGQLHESLENAARLVAVGRGRVAEAEQALAAIEADEHARPATLAAARDELTRARAELGSIDRQRQALPAMIAALDQFAADRDPWQMLADDEHAVVSDVLVELHRDYGQIVRLHVPPGTRELATLSLRTMATGAADALAAIPDAELERINREAGSSGRRHRLLAPGGDGTLILLELGCDDMMEWRWSGHGSYRFTLSHAAIAEADWGAAQLVLARG